MSLPLELIGPHQSHYLSFSKVEADEFVQRNKLLFPHLHEAFLREICFQHAHRFDEYFPNFDPQKCMALPVQKTMGWIYENIKYDYNEELDFWYKQYDSYEPNDLGYFLKGHMLEYKNWPMPIIMIEASLAIKLGASKNIVGRPYYLIEGTRRTSYARRMMELGLIDKNALLTMIEVQSPTA